MLGSRRVIGQNCPTSLSGDAWVDPTRHDANTGRRRSQRGLSHESSVSWELLMKKVGRSYQIRVGTLCLHFSPDGGTQSVPASYT